DLRRAHQTGRSRPRTRNPGHRGGARGTRPAGPRPVVHLPADVARAGPGALAVLTAGLVHAAERALPALPAPLTPPIAELIGTAAYALSPGTRAAVRANLRVVAPERADPATVRHVFVEQARNYLE